MNIKDIYNSVSSGVKKTGKSVLNLLNSEPINYVAPERIPTPVKGTVNPNRITESIRYLESSGGKDPNTPRNQIRSYMIPAMNGNEQDRTISYDIGYGGEYGLTPLALAELAKSSIDRKAATSTHTKFGPPLIPGIDPKEIQKELMSEEGAGRLSNLYYNKRTVPKDFTPETLTNHYIDNYVSHGTTTPKSRKRVLDYYRSITE